MEALSRGKHLFSNCEVPSSHWLLRSLDEEVPDGFTYCKVKLGKAPEEELSKLPVFFINLPERVTVRLDFNNRVDYSLFKRYVNVLHPYLQKIDFIEDPFNFDPGIWETIQSEYSIKLAADVNSERYIQHHHSHAVTIIKPAVQDDGSMIKKASHKVVYTSYLDHPIGQVAAAYAASLGARNNPGKVLTCGLLSHCVYQTNKYSEELLISGDRLVPPPRGTGFGFDEQLKQEHWKELLR